MAHTWASSCDLTTDPCSHLGVAAELREAQAASSKAAAAAAASASALKAAATERDAAQRTAAAAEHSSAAARQQAEAAGSEAVSLLHELQVAETTAAQLKEEAAGLRSHQEAEAQRAAELQRALDGAAAQLAAAERSYEERAAALELHALEAAAAADQEQRRLRDGVAALQLRAVRQQQECARLRAALDKKFRRGFCARLFSGSQAEVAPDVEGPLMQRSLQQKQPDSPQLPKAGAPRTASLTHRQRRWVMCLLRQRKCLRQLPTQCLVCQPNRPQQRYRLSRGRWQPSVRQQRVR